MTRPGTEGLAQVLGSVLDDLHAAELALDDDAPLPARSLVSMAIGRVSAAVAFLEDAPADDELIDRVGLTT